jgi:hypothetical protein
VDLPVYGVPMSLACLAPPGLLDTE